MNNYNKIFLAIVILVVVTSAINVYIFSGLDRSPIMFFSIFFFIMWTYIGAIYIYTPMGKEQFTTQTVLAMVVLVGNIVNMVVQ